MKRNVTEGKGGEILDRLWDAYRLATPEPKVSPNFMPVLWAKIDGAWSAGWTMVLPRLATRMLPMAAAVILAVATYGWNRRSEANKDTLSSSYIDALVADFLEEEQPDGWVMGS